MNTLSKDTIIELLSAFISQRSGMDFRNYGDIKSYRAESRRITQQGKDARELMRAVEYSQITADELRAAFSAFSGRLTLSDDGRLDYCTGQYFPTEYRAAVCAVLASALWDYHREDYPNGNELRASFRRRFGKRIQESWFN